MFYHNYKVQDSNLEFSNMTGNVIGIYESLSKNVCLLARSSPDVTEATVNNSENVKQKDSFSLAIHCHSRYP